MGNHVRTRSAEICLLPPRNSSNFYNYDLLSTLLQSNNLKLNAIPSNNWFKKLFLAENEDPFMGIYRYLMQNCQKDIYIPVKCSANDVSCHALPS